MGVFSIPFFGRRPPRLPLCIASPSELGRLFPTSPSYPPNVEGITCVHLYPKCAPDPFDGKVYRLRPFLPCRFRLERVSFILAPPFRLATTALACRTALPSDAPRRRAEVATSLHWRWAFGDFAFRVCRLALRGDQGIFSRKTKSPVSHFHSRGLHPSLA